MTRARPGTQPGPSLRLGRLVYLDLTGSVIADPPVSGTDYTSGSSQSAQAAGELQALGGRGRPIVRLHLSDRAAGLAQLLEAVR